MNIENWMLDAKAIRIAYEIEKNYYIWRNWKIGIDSFDLMFESFAIGDYPEEIMNDLKDRTLLRLREKNKIASLSPFAMKRRGLIN